MNNQHLLEAATDAANGSATPSGATPQNGAVQNGAVQGEQGPQIGSEGAPVGTDHDDSLGDLRRQFASDNYAGICPEAWDALTRANRGHAPGYGDDIWTARATDALRDLFETDCEVFFVFNGTAANSLALASLCRSYHSVLCHSLAHIETDECGAPEFFSNGTKVLLLPGENGKIEADSIVPTVKRRSDLHYPKPQVVSITQATECGTVYTPAEVGAIGEAARSVDLRVHMDGARFSNAVASLGCSPADVTWRAGVDVLCFGATKAGVPVGEAVVFFKRELAHEFDYRCKQAGQLASKMRFLSAPWLGLLQNDAWLKRAGHANAMAALMEEKLRAAVPDLKVLFPRQANSLFVQLPAPVEAAMHERGWRFYNFIGAGGSRLMCSWDTQPENIDAFVADVLACSA